MKALSEKLRKLPKHSPHRSAASRIREIIEDVEYARSQGVSYKELVRELEKAGVAISVDALRAALRRYRKKRDAASGKTRSAPAKKSSPPVAATTASARRSGPGKLDSCLSGLLVSNFSRKGNRRGARDEQTQSQKP